MFSSIGSIFTQKPRHAETTDTRQAIREQARDQRQRRDGDASDEHDPRFNEDDNAMVSIEALRHFLKNFLHSAQIARESTQETLNETSEDSNPLKDKGHGGVEGLALESLKATLQKGFTLSKPKSITQAHLNAPAPTSPSEAKHRAAYASRAYQHSAEASPSHGRRNAHTSAPSMPKNLEISADETRTIHLLLEDLKILSARNVEFLRIEPGKSFLDSLALAVKKKKFENQTQ